jgi:DNA (cytosine-5)-methyltransferase 1
VKVGELFAGYGGLGMGVQAVFPDAELAWYSDVCKFDKNGNAGHYDPHRGPCRVLAHRFPGVPNLGDVTRVDWSAVEPVDVLTGGSPCQDLSHAGRRAGMTEGTRSNLWVAMREAIAVLRPSLVVWENVRGAYSAEADSALEHCPGCMGARRPEPVLRALGRVLGDLSDLGYVGGWHGIRAADVGAPHGRFRVFVVAHDDSSRQQGVRRQLARGHDADGRGGAHSVGHGAEPAALLPSPRTSDTNGAGAHGDGGLDLRTAVTMLLGTPTARDHKGSGHGDRLAESLRRGQVEAQVLSLLPTPAVNDMGEGKTVEAWDAWTEKMKAAHGNGNGHGPSLAIEAQRLLPTPVTSDTQEPVEGGQVSRGYGAQLRDAEQLHRNWGQYADAIHRWEALTRPAPPPTETGPKGNPRLSAAFSEWLMGLPAGWVTDVPGITRNEALKLAGNGVVPQQAEAAIRFLLMTAPVLQGAA